MDINDPAFDAEFAADLSSFGTPKTTNDIRAFKEGEVRTYSFSSCQIFGLNCFPGLMTATSEPPRVNPAQDIGIRSTASVGLLDFISNDSYELQGLYANRRVIGSFWAKMFARNEFKFREARILRGYTEDGSFYPANFETEHYIIDTYQEPTLDGMVRFNLIDVLALTDSVNVKIPEVTTGLLSAAIDPADTTCSFNALNTSAEYGTAGFWIIGDNIMQYTITSTTTANIVQSRFGTANQEQEINSSIQRCLAWENENVIDIMFDIFALTQIPASYIPTAKWNALKAGELSIFNFTAVIFQPTEAKELLNELIQHCGLTLYTDVVLKEITIVASSVISSPVMTFTADEHFQVDTFTQTNAFEKLVTNQFIRWGIRDHTKTERTNYSKNKRVVNIQQEDASRLRIGSAGKDIVSRWLANNLDGNQIADQIATRIVASFSTVPKQIKFKTDASYVGDLPDDKRLWLGSTYQVRLPKNCQVNASGQEVTLVLQCTSIRPDSTGLVEVTGLSYNANIPPAFDFTVRAGTYTNYVLADDPAFAAILTEGGAKEYVVIIEQGALFGSSSVSTPSFRQGTFPSGATLYLIVFGRILGRGGNGGKGGDVDNEGGICIDGFAFDGQNGGPALSLSTDTKLDVLYGLIGGGGGGNAGRKSTCPDARSGDGGGGGQGFPAGLGAPAGDVGGGTSYSGFNGTDGSTDAPGLTAGFIPAGALGEDGKGYPLESSIGGTGGAAILTNGNTLDIIAGDSADKIKGLVI